MKKYLPYVKLTVSAGLLLFLFRKADLPELLGKLAAVNPLIVMVAFAVLLLQSAVSSLKWKMILASEAKIFPFSFLLKTYLIGSFLSLFLPSSFGGDVYRIYALKKYNEDFVQNTSSVLFDRLTGLFALASISILSFAFLTSGGVSYSFLGAYLAGIASFGAASSEKAVRFTRRFENRLLRLLNRLLRSFANYRNDLRMLGICLLISFLFQSNIVFLNKIYAIALGIDISLGYLFLVIPLIYLTEMLPITINGFGIREGAFVFFLGRAGYSTEQALSLALLVISARYMFTLLTGGILAFREFYGGRDSKKPPEGAGARP